MSSTSAPWQPPLRWWNHLWRDVVCVLIGLVLWATVVEQQVEQEPVLFYVDIVGAVLAGILVHWRRRWPMTVAILTLVLTPFSALCGGFALLATLSAATRRVWWQLAVLGVANLVATWAYYAVQPEPETDPAWLIILFTVLFVAAGLAWGMFIGSRRELLWTLRQRAEAAEAERDLRVGQARAAERTRIAREMHDVLAHRISQISLHAGALTYRDDLTADEMRSSVAVIQDKAHEALADLRSVLGVLRDAEGSLADRPQPTYDDLVALVATSREAGANIVLEAEVADGALPEALGRTVYRIVQEGLTNAVKHAPAAGIVIRITGSPGDGVDIAVVNRIGFGPTRTPGARLGLVGLAERVALSGGRLSHGVEDGRFVLRAWLPWAP